MLVSQWLPGWEVRGSGSQLLPNSERELGWSIGDHGFQMIMTKQTPRVIEQYLRDWVVGWLRPHGLSLGDIANWAVHPGGPKILAAVQAALGLPDVALADSWQILADYGNMSSPTVFFIMKKQFEKRLSGPVVSLGFGPGLVVEAALFEQ